jgi:diguanylate cyclase (GGDEF)-like protein
MARWLSFGNKGHIHSKERAMDWAYACAGWLLGRRFVGDGEAVVHDLSTRLQQAGDPQEIAGALIDSVRRLTGAASVRWARDDDLPAGSREDGQEFRLLDGGQSRGRLIIGAGTTASAEGSRVTRRRLQTLCNMAACALARQDRPDGRATEPVEGPSDLPAASNPEQVGDAAGPGSGRTGREFTRPTVQDATFLGAVLPFALGQSRRHGEPLSLLCVAIDRLHGIRELLGSEVATRAVQNVGAHVAAELRSSDIVARIDDDRIIVALPRARIHGALHVAQRICRSVETTRSLLPELPCLTVSIGVAECPSSALDVDALLDAADLALTAAKNQGRNRAVAAPGLTTQKRMDRPSLAG